MIKTSFKRDSNDRIIGFTMTGHADYGEDDEFDMVCSAVSAVSIGTINNIERLVKSKPDTLDSDQINGGFLDYAISYNKSSMENHDIELLLENFYLTYKDIAEQYPVFAGFTD